MRNRLAQVKKQLALEGHLNVYVRDHDSVVTGFGKHDRVVCFQPQGDTLYMRIDHKWGLGMPTEAEMLEVARKDQELRGRWKLKEITRLDGYSSDVNWEKL